MKINSEKLRSKVAQAEIAPEQLAEALPVASGRRKQRELAVKKVGNWLRGSDHPRCKAADIVSMADVLGCSPGDIAQFTSRACWTRSSPRKARLVADLIRGKNALEAQVLLGFSPKRAAVFVGKVLHAAIEDARMADADIERLVITESRVDEGPIIKRFRPKDRGRAHPIHKVTSHIVVGLEEVG